MGMVWDEQRERSDGMKKWKAICALAAFSVWALAGWSHAEPAAESSSYNMIPDIRGYFGTP